jgi:hypothetical protein
MQRKLLLAALILFIALPLLAQELTVDQVIAKNIEAHGGMAKLKSVNTMKATGRLALPNGMEIPITAYQMRPNKQRLEIHVQGMTGIQAYDGTNGWQLMPFQGKKDPEPVSPDEAKEMADDSDIDGPLVDYKEKGNKVELLGKEKVEGADAYKLKVTMKNGTEKLLYLDADSFLEIKSESKRTRQGNIVESEASIGDYKEVDGMMMAHAVEAGPKGRPERQKFIMDKIEINVPVDAAIFNMPPPAPAAASPEEKKEPAQTNPPPAKPADKPKTEDKPKQ